MIASSTAGLALRFAWVGTGPISSEDDEAVAAMARAKRCDVAA
jgi:hypothetical protein